MRIAVVLGKFPSLSQTFVLNQLTGLLDAGHELDIFSADPGPQGRSIVHDEVDQYRLQDRVRYWPDNFLEVLLGATRALAASVTRPRASFRTAARMLPVVVRGLRRPGCLAELAKAVVTVDEPAYDLIYCHFSHIGLSACRLRSLGAIQGRLVTVFHGYDISRLVQQRGPRFLQPLLRDADLLLPISRFWQERLVSLGADPARCHVHHMAIDTGRFVYRSRHPGPEGVTRIVTIARFVEKKGLADAIRAIAELVKRHPGQLEYHLIGSGPLETQLKTQVRASGLAEVVIFQGVMKQREMVRALEGMHLMLAPSVTAADGDMEGIPVALMEAMAVGMPVVSTRHSGIPELVEDGVSGYLVEEHDVDALVGRLEELIRNPALWPQMGLRGRHRVENSFDTAQCNECLLEHIDSLCKGSEDCVSVSPRQ